MSKIAKEIGVDTSTVWCWETDRSVPQKRLIPAVAKVLKVDIADLGRAIAVQQTQDEQGVACR